MCEGITIIHILWMVISQIVAVSMALKRINIRFIVLLLWMLVGIGIVVVISSSKVLLRVMVWMLDMQTPMKMSRVMSSNIIIRKLILIFSISYTRNIVSKIWLVLLLQLVDKTVVLLYRSPKIYLSQFQISMQLLISWQWVFLSSGCEVVL